MKIPIACLDILKVNFPFNYTFLAQGQAVSGSRVAQLVSCQPEPAAVRSQAQAKEASSLQSTHTPPAACGVQVPAPAQETSPPLDSCAFRAAWNWCQRSTYIIFNRPRSMTPSCSFQSRLPDHHLFHQTLQIQDQNQLCSGDPKHLSNRGRHL
jgi:hypothetical protein